MVLPDLLRPELELVICGMAAGTTSASLGHYYARPGNRFWNVLHQSGLTPILLSPEDDERILEFGIGLTDLNKAESGRDHEISNSAIDVIGLGEKLRRYRPRRLAFNGISTARVWLGNKRAKLDYGVQPWQAEGAECWVVHQTSGGNGHYSASSWHALAAAMRGLAAPHGMG